VFDITKFLTENKIYLNEAKNPFSLYSDLSGWEGASKAIQGAIDVNARHHKAGIVTSEDAAKLVHREAAKWRKFGATDTASMEAITDALEKSLGTKLAYRVDNY
jgi:hypothetical protein